MWSRKWQVSTTVLSETHSHNHFLDGFMSYHGDTLRTPPAHWVLQVVLLLLLSAPIANSCCSARRCTQRPERGRGGAGDGQPGPAGPRLHLLAPAVQRPGGGACHGASAQAHHIRQVSRRCGPHPVLGLM